ncbi:MAG: hypothetical protein EOO77_24205 [Oxalobacteraceae bacterium]|nr:MAG: hypothetical protein EOO77_24205 [Oxalobacteraceae bacterium]
MSDLAGGVFKDCYGRIVRVRGTEFENDTAPNAHMLYDELVGPHGFTKDSEYAAELVPYVHPYRKRPKGVYVDDVDLDHFSDVVKSRDHWMAEAVKYQNLAHARRPLLHKIGEYAGFFLIVVPFRLFQVFVLRHKGPFS